MTFDGQSRSSYVFLEFSKENKCQKPWQIQPEMIDLARPPTWTSSVYSTLVMDLWLWHRVQGAVSIRKTVLPGMAIPMLKIRRPSGRLIFNMEIAIRR